MTRPLRLLLLGSLLLLASAPAARADGDPASDFLLGQRVFYPVGLDVPRAERQRLTDAVRQAAQGGFPIRVALIANEYDLGSVPQLWKQPQRYARFLSAELAIAHHDALLTEMPNGFGFWWPKHDTARERALVAKLAGPESAVGFIRDATAAVRRLAALHGVIVRPKAVTTAAPAIRGTSGGGGRAGIAVAAAAALVAAAALGVLLLRRRRR